MSEGRKKHKQSRFFTIMLVPDSTSSKVRSLKVHHWFLYMVAGISIAVGLTIFGLSALNTHSQLRLVQTVKIVEETQQEKQELLSEKEQIEAQKKNIEESLNSQKGNFDKQIELYIERIAEIETRLIEIESKAQESYRKMDESDFPVSINGAETFMGGNFIPAVDSNTLNTDKLNLYIASVDVKFKRIEGFVEAYVEDVDKYAQYMAAMPTIWPVKGTVTSEYGGRDDPFTGASASHSGIDIKASTGTLVKATGDGVIKRAEYSSGYGYLIVIDHGYGIETYYAHNSELLMKTGDHVKRGDYIAKSGSTGRSTGPHVHYEVRINGALTNPREYLGAM